MIKMITGEQLRIIREQLRLSQEKMANALKISREMVSKMETGKVDISTRTVAMLSNYFADNNLIFNEASTSIEQFNNQTNITVENLTAKGGHNLQNQLEILQAQLEQKEKFIEQQQRIIDVLSSQLEILSYQKKANS